LWPSVVKVPHRPIVGLGPPTNPFALNLARRISRDVFGMVGPIGVEMPISGPLGPR